MESRIRSRGWLREMPEGWDERRGKFLFRHVKEINRGMKCQNRLALTMKGVLRRPLDDAEGLQSEDYSCYQIVERDNLIFKLIDLENYKTSRVGLIPEQGIVSPAYIRLVPNGRLLPGYSFWFYYALYVKGVFNQMGAGVRQTLTSNELLDIRAPLPPPSIQRKIADYLDAATGKIDRLVGLRRRQMELLQEQRAALIQQAVTRGLDPNAPLKDSGIPWLGKIPRHWEVKRLKHIARFVQTGSTPPSANSEYYDENGLNWYGPGDFSGALQLGTSARRISELSVHEGYAEAYEPPIILVVGIGASVGKIGFADQRCFTNQQVNAVGLRSIHSAFFFANFLASFSDIIASSANHATLPIFNQTQTRNFPVVVPPRPEQLKIEKHIQQVDERFAGLLTAYARQIEMLGEYRAALIHEAVTGQKAV